MVVNIHQDIERKVALSWQTMANSRAFTPLCIQLVRTGEASGALDMLENLARHHHEHTQNLAEG